LNKLKLYGLERERITVQEFRQAFSRAFNGGISMGDIEFGGSVILGDKQGQSAAKLRLINNTISVLDRFYINYTNQSHLQADFVAPDLANDPDTNGWQIRKFDVSSAGMNAVLEFDAAIALNGRPAIFDTHTTASMTVTSGSGSTRDTIHRAAGSFVTDGFYAGQTIIFEGTGCGANDGTQALIYSVTATDITVHGGTL
jgi:hypothetical protein